MNKGILALGRPLFFFKIRAIGWWFQNTLNIFQCWQRGWDWGRCGGGVSRAEASVQKNNAKSGVGVSNINRFWSYSLLGKDEGILEKWHHQKGYFLYDRSRGPKTTLKHIWQGVEGRRWKGKVVVGLELFPFKEAFFSFLVALGGERLHVSLTT